MSALLVLVLLVVPIAAVTAWYRVRRDQRYGRAGTVEVRVDEFGVRRLLADGRTEEVDWTEVSEVSVFTADRGPYAAAGGAVVLFGDATRGCVVPFDWLETSGLAAALGRLPGFEARRLAEAMESRTHRPVTCWERSA